MGDGDLEKAVKEEEGRVGLWLKKEVGGVGELPAVTVGKLFNANS